MNKQQNLRQGNDWHGNKKTNSMSYSSDATSHCKSVHGFCNPKRSGRRVADRDGRVARSTQNQVLQGGF
jgi:hypothetical protein